MIDTHCHIQSSDYDADRDAVLAQAAADGVEALIVPAIDEPSFVATMAMTVCASPTVYAAIGVHPHHASEVTSGTYERIQQHMTQQQVVAVGEIGLDYHYDLSPRDIQQSVFREQVRIARAAGKPVIVHNRESDDDLLRILEEEQDGSLRGVLHCFSSSADVLRKALAQSLHVSFTANITFKNSTLGEVVREAPLDRIMLETDSPWMSPPPWRGKRNEPGRVRLVAEKIAEIKNIDIAAVLQATTANARRFFGLAVLLLVLAASAAFAQAPPPPPPPPPPPMPPLAGTEHDSVATATRDTVIIPKFHRQLGIGFGIATSTLSPQEGNTSEANLFTTNAQVNYMFSPSVGVDVRYWHFINNKYGFAPRVDTTGQGRDLNDYYNALDLDVRFVFNPKNRVVIGGLVGGSMLFFDQPITQTKASVPALFGGLTVGVNLQFDWGLLHPYGEYRVVKEVGSPTYLGPFPVSRGNDFVAVAALGIMYYFPEGFVYR